MKNVVFCFIAIVILSCNKSGYDKRFNITVVGKTWECSSFVIRIENNIEEASQILGEQKNKELYTAVNLPVQYQISGKKLSVTIRRPYENETAVFCFAVTQFPVDLVYLDAIYER